MFRKNPIIILLSALLLSMFIILSFPPQFPDDHINIIIEIGYVVVCVILLFKIEQVRESHSVYLVVFMSTALLLLGGSIDLFDEFYELPDYIELMEDGLKGFGFFFFVSACFRWVNYHREQMAKIQHLAEVDSLTGVSNRRAFLKLSKTYFDLNDKESNIVSMLVIDIDHFKQINDSYGHQCGDKVLINVANTIKLGLRKGDYVARIGGEEFVVLLKNTDDKAASVVAEKIRLNVEKMTTFCEEREVLCTVSIGITTSSSEAFEFDELFVQADKALYSAKNMGRNRWVVS